jgi:hypothetical protein
MIGHACVDIVPFLLYIVLSIIYVKYGCKGGSQGIMLILKPILFEVKTY